MRDTKFRVHLNIDGTMTPITMAEVVDYYARSSMGARDIMSGCRRIGKHIGDWRPIDNIANYALNYFKSVARKELRRASLDRGLIPNF